MRGNELVLGIALPLALLGCGASNNQASMHVITTVKERASILPLISAVMAEPSPIVAILGYRDQYNVSKSNDVVTVTNKGTNQSFSYQAALTVKFFDRTVSYDVRGPAGQIYRMFQAAYKRKPTNAELGSRMYLVDQGEPLAFIADALIRSGDFMPYGTYIPDATFVGRLYSNVVGYQAPSYLATQQVNALASGSSRVAVFQSISESTENQNALNGVLSGGFEYDVYVTGVSKADRTSYTIAKNNIPSKQLPEHADAYIVADFKNNGSPMLFAAHYSYTSGSKTADLPSQFTFYAKATNGKWVKDSTMIDTPAGCIHPRKAVVNDFNSDGKLDILVACHGYDRAPFEGEQMWLVSSTPSGKYTSKAIMGIGFFHNATAADFDGDGNIDIVATDSKANSRVRMFMGDGTGGFIEAYNRFPSVVLNHNYYTVEATDVNYDGKIDLLIGAEEKDNNSPTIIVLGDGNADFAYDKLLTIPSVPINTTVLDFLLFGNTLLVNRTSSDPATYYNTKVTQSVDLTTMSSQIVSSEVGTGWTRWLVPVTATITMTVADTN